jgi:hypothetical protein
MDYWVCTSEQIKDIPKRLEMIKQITDENPGLPHADACRRAVYILGQQPR